MKMFVLAGGLGTRLQSAVADVPKALAPVQGVPFLQLQIEHWVEQGLGAFVFLLRHQADHIIQFLEMQRTGVLSGCDVDYVVEPSPMGTGGAVAHAIRALRMSGEFLLTNADTWLGRGVREMMMAPAPAVAVVELRDVGRYGSVQFDSDSRTVTSFAEKCPSNSGPGWINAGMCHLHAGLFKDWDGHPYSLEQDLFEELVSQGSLTAVPLQTDFVDIGVPNDYYLFCRWMERERQTRLCT